MPIFSRTHSLVLQVTNNFASLVRLARHVLHGSTLFRTLARPIVLQSTTRICYDSSAAYEALVGRSSLRFIQCSTHHTIQALTDIYPMHLLESISTSALPPHCHHTAPQTNACPTYTVPTADSYPPLPLESTISHHITLCRIRPRLCYQCWNLFAPLLF